MNFFTNSLFILLLIIVFYFTFYKSRPAKNQQGSVIQPPINGFQDSNRKQLVIGTYNVQTGKDENGNRNIYRSANVIKNADIVGIQEVYASTWLGSQSQAQQLAEHSLEINNDFGWLFAATRRRWLREHRGNALLSRLPVKKWTVEMLPDDTGKQFRNLITAIIDFNGHEIAILVTHLHTKQGREQQLAKVLEKSKQYEYVILMGDFNTGPSNPLLKEYLNESGFIDAIASSQGNLELQEQSNIEVDQRIDWILSKGFKVISGLSEPIGISDHPYYQVTFSLASTNESTVKEM